MPGGDKTGPEGMGPLTGRKLGNCTGNNYPGLIEQNLNFGRGYGRGLRIRQRGGRGMGYGRRYGFQWDYPEDAPRVSEKTLLENEIRILKNQLSSLEEKLLKAQEDKS